MLGWLFLTRKVCHIFLEQPSFSSGMFIDMFHKPQILNWKRTSFGCFNSGFVLVQRPKRGRKEKFPVSWGKKSVSTSRHTKMITSLQTYLNEISAFQLFPPCFLLQKTFAKFNPDSLTKVQNCNFFQSIMNQKITLPNLTESNPLFCGSKHCLSIFCLAHRRYRFTRPLQLSSPLESPVTDATQKLTVDPLRPYQKDGK